MHFREIMGPRRGDINPESDNQSLYFVFNLQLRPSFACPEEEEVPRTSFSGPQAPFERS